MATRNYIIVGGKGVKSFLAKFKLKNLRFSNVKIGSKYGLILGTVLGLFVISTIVVGFFLQSIQTEIDAMDRRADRAADVTEMGSLIRAKSIRVYQYMNDPSSDIVNEFNERRDLFNALKEELEPKMDTEEEKSLFTIITELDEQFNLRFSEVVSFVSQGDMENATHVAGSAINAQEQTVEQLDKLTTLVNEQRESASDSATESTSIICTNHCDSYLNNYKYYFNNNR